jgi:protein SCO1/2
MIRGAALALAVALAAAPARADTSDPPAENGPEAARAVDIDEHLGRPVSRDLAFTDMNGRRVRLGDYLGDGKPVILVLAYYHCPMLCGLVLRGAVEGLSLLRYRLGEEYHAVTVSFDPRERPEAAAAKRMTTLAALGASTSTPEWPFLVGSAESSRTLADELGFRYAYDARTDQYAHPAALFVLTPEGRISRYLYGTEFSARDLRLALLEASRGEIGSIVDRVIMTCYHYDPSSRKYGPFIVGFLRLGAVVILFTAVGLLAILWSRERARPARARGAPLDQGAGRPRW